MILTCISDTHTKHRSVKLPGGDILLFAGDLMNTGYKKYEIEFFCKWFSKQLYKHKIFIAGNHDQLFQLNSQRAMRYVKPFDIIYLQDSTWVIDGIKIYGSPFGPQVGNWAFGLPRAGDELKAKWDAIPEDTDILITHTPPKGYLDTSGPPYSMSLLGCELLRDRIEKHPPKLHVFGHIHESHGYKFNKGVHYINASDIKNPITIDWDPETNKIKDML